MSGTTRRASTNARPERRSPDGHAGYPRVAWRPGVPDDPSSIVMLNFLLFRMMPGSPERVLLRNPHLTAARSARPQANAGVSTSRSSRISSSSYTTVDRPGRPRLLVPVPRHAGLGGHRAALLADDPADRPGRGHRDRVGLALGAYAGWRRGGPVDRVGNGISLVLYSMPYFVIGMPLIIIFATALGWFPTSGMLTPRARTTASIADRLVDFGRHLVLPLATVSLGPDRRVLHPDALVDHRDAVRGLRARPRGPRA